VFELILVKQKIMGSSLLLLGLIFILYSIAALAYRVSFAKFLILLGIFLAGTGTFLLQERYKVHIPKGVALVMKVSIIIFLTSFIIIEGVIIYHGSKTDQEKVDYLIILGAGLWGETPSLSLQQRLEESLDFIKKNPTTRIVLSGGMGPGETITEAEAMKRYLVKRGVDDSLIIKEDKSTNTKENLLFTKELLKKDNGTIKIQLITNNFHMFRAKLLARSCGFEVYGQPATLHPLLVPAYYLREYMAVLKSVIFDLR
jgi:uncharacterized SAM-binding protein YcdF (DUF218 family)